MIRDRFPFGSWIGRETQRASVNRAYFWLYREGEGNSFSRVVSFCYWVMMNIGTPDPGSEMRSLDDSTIQFEEENTYDKGSDQIALVGKVISEKALNRGL